jgi:hypothetical protein
MRHTQSRAAMARDAALDRVTRTRRWVIVGSAALTAGFAALVSAVAPGKSLASKPKPQTEASTAAAPSGSGSSGSSASSGASRSAIPRLPPPANPSSLGLQGPDDAPAPAPQQSQPQSDPSQSQPQSAPAPPAPPVVSGGS